MRVWLLMFPTHNWAFALEKVTRSINMTPNHATNYSPYRILYGTNPQSDLGSERPINKIAIQNSVTLNRESYNNKTKQYKDKKRFNQLQQISLGNKVLLSTCHNGPNGPGKFAPRDRGPYTIKKICSPVSYRLDLGNNSKHHNTFHQDMLRKYIFYNKGHYVVLFHSDHLKIHIIKNK
jgi:hypothetical protein